MYIAAVLSMFAFFPYAGYAALTCDMSSMTEEIRLEFEEVEVQGTFERSFEKSIFRPDGSDEPWWTSSDELNDMVADTGRTKLRIVLRGFLSPEGRYGHARSYKRCLAYPRIIRVVGTAEK